MSRGTYVISGDGTKIWAESAGDPSKPTVVFIHGFACTALAFDKQFFDERLLKNLHLIRYEMRGHGRSGMPDLAAAYESIRYAQDFRAVCEAFKVKKPFLAGWSIGSTIPVDVTDAYGADYLSGLIYFGGIPWRSIHPEIATEFILSMIPQLLSFDLAPFHKTATQFAESCVADPSTVPYETLLQWMGGVTVQPPIVRVHGLSRTQDEMRFLKEGVTTLPSLVIHGSEDKHVKSDAVVSKFKENFANVEIHVLKGAGHAAFWERPEETGDLILDFVNRWCYESSDV